MKLISKQLISEMKKWRHDFHANPEIAYQEIQTSASLVNILEKTGFSKNQIHQGFANTGVVATLKKNANERTLVVALRADMDALSIEEKNNFDHVSCKKGYMHACGHDGHMAMLLGAAKYLYQNQDQLKGTIHFVFQPAEENEAGAKRMIEEGFLDEFPCDEIYGMHNYPGIEEGSFCVQEGAVMASFDNFDITINGKGGHAAYPENTIDPVPIAAQIITGLQNLISRSHAQNPAVLSITRLDAGSAYNIIPDTALLRGTVRTLDPGEQNRLESQIKSMATGIAQSFQAQAEVVYKRNYPVTINSREPTIKSMATIKKLFGEQKLITNFPPAMGSEDFSFFSNKIPGCYVKLGAGPLKQGEGLHNSKYDFNDRLLEIGAAYWSQLAMDLLK